MFCKILQTDHYKLTTYCGFLLEADQCYTGEGMATGYNQLPEEPETLEI